MVETRVGRGATPPLTGAHPQDSQSTMIPSRRPPSSRPFLAAPRTDFYHPARAIDAALHGLERAIRRSEGIGLVVGAPGTGKTLLLAKIAEHVRDDFDVALLSGARICTRRALWQSILAEVGEPYRGIDEGELRISVVERVRGLAATGSGLAILVDEAHTLPSRLLEELRLLTNIPTPLPSVHVVLAGTTEMEERLGGARMESLAQRVGGRHYLEPLDHAETLAYLRTQMRAAGRRWEDAFEQGADDAVFAVTDGIPRLVNQVCDLALVTAAERGKARVNAADVAAAWRDIQRLPAPGAAAVHAPAPQPARLPGTLDDQAPTVVEYGVPDAAFDMDDAAEPWVTHEFGAAGDPDDARDQATIPGRGRGAGIPVEDSAEFSDELPDGRCADDAPWPRGREGSPAVAAGGSLDPWSGPEVEIVFEADDDPFAGYFGAAEAGPRAGGPERYVVRGPDDFAARRHVSSREGAALAKRLPAAELAPADPGVPEAPRAAASPDDDADLLVIEEDEWTPPPDPNAWRVLPVRPGDYSRLFARMRRGASDV